ncbi:MAG: bifunctional methylenetetrahydrofolate dehydrogenase/methenyltetrahydrofolate cyclohydrolase FolD [Nitrospirae bacterium]|nr:bifunctional methylenetetrahydrofolate dehydrogenase/methenyltetrahydrofolate cyclohydrolase FolD [Nitrospirota bacterium]
MTAKILDGKSISEEIKNTIKSEVVRLKEKGVTPGLAVVLVGDNPASKVYVKNKQKACENVGIYSEEHKLPESTSQEELLSLVDRLNKDSKIHGILVQLPLPKHINSDTILKAINPSKDVDGFHPYNVGMLLIGEPVFIPCTPYGVMKMVEHSGISVEGKTAVVVGRSNIVGKPVALLLMQKNATVTICHSKTKDLAEVCKNADILIAAIGKPKMIRANMVKEGAVVIDVGINRLDDGSLVGDVDYEEVSKKAGWITPVPGGVGPMTITMLLNNTLEAARKSAKGS